MTDAEFQTLVLEKLQVINERQAVIKTVLLGAESDTGLVGKVTDVYKGLDDLKGRFKLLVGVLIGSGVLTGAAVGITRILAS